MSQAVAGPALVSQDVEAWLDQLVPKALREGAIPGAVVVIVKDNKVLVAKGYGVADVARGTPMSSADTIVRTGSISKVFTWTAIMQLAEQGKLDLDTDINRYLDFRIPPYAGKPITLRDLMTHTAGFEEVSKNLLVVHAGPLTPLDRILKRWVPRRIFGPGSLAGYSNYGATLGGYIVQRVSGERYETYISLHILRPLGMTRSTFDQPVQPALRSMLAKGYPNTFAPPFPFERTAMSPAGGQSTTGDDMARFMIAHLGDGRYEAVQILRPETARLMHRTIRRLVPPLNGSALGFFEQSLNGHMVIGHTGDTNVFHSQMSLFIDDGIGIFFAANATGVKGAVGPLRQAILTGFADRYFPAQFTTPKAPPARAVGDAKLIAGLYQSARRPESTLASIANLFSGLRVTALPNGDVSIFGKSYREIAPFVWREIDGHDRVSVVLRDGKVVKLANDAYGPALTFTPMPWAQSPAWMLPALAASLLTFALTLLWWLSSTLIRRFRATSPQPSGHRKRAYRAVGLVAILPLATAAAWWSQLTAISDGGEVSDAMLRVTQALSLATLVGGGAVVAYYVWAVWRAPRDWAARAWSIVLVAAVAMLSWIILLFHLVGGGIEY
jgi:CubicO group peptidase (beta-lactamase class C family)